MTTLIRSAVSAAFVFIAATAIPLTSALAAGEHEGGHGDGISVGAPGSAADVTRTVTVFMRDNYFEPETLDVAAGETIRFVVTNAGEFVHEFNIGTADMHRKHQEEMAMMVEHNVLMPDRIDMKAAAKMQDSMGHGMHEDANSVLLEPGGTGEVIWTFPKEGDVAIEFGCNVPGHYDAGMVGAFQLSHTTH